MRQFGVSFNSTDFVKTPDLADQVLKITRDGIFDFVQPHALMTHEFYDDIYTNVKEKMKGVRAVIHAPFHLPLRYIGVDTSDKSAFENNLKMLEFSQKCADLLRSEAIVLHPGIGDSEKYVDETIRQLRKINDMRIAIENLPYDPFGVLMHRGRVENIQRILEETNCKFCFDFGHAICAANSLQRDVYSDFKE